MVDSAAHLVDQVLPSIPIRQWVLAFPYPLRLLYSRISYAPLCIVRYLAATGASVTD
jgi:hypothetical protein